MSQPPKERRPWPMKWIIVGILVFIVPYTWLTLRYRKPGPAYRPYEDMKTRANTLRLLNAGYQRIALGASRPAVATNAVPATPTTAAPGGMSAGLKTSLVDLPRLPDEILRVSAPTSIKAASPCAIEFACTLPDNRQQLASAELYVRGEEIVIAPEFEQLSGGLLARTRESVVLLTVPAGALKPGRYRVTLAGAQASRTWTLQVK